MRFRYACPAQGRTTLREWDGRVRRTSIVSSAVVALALFAAACGSSDDSETTTATSSADAPEGTPIKVAALINATGPLNGGQDGVGEVLQAWAATTNAEGGVAGRPVAIEVMDTEGNPSNAAATAQDVVDDPSFAAAVIFDPPGEAASAKVLSGAGLPVIGGNGFDPTVWGATPGNEVVQIPQMKNVFGVATAFPASGAGFAMAAQEAGFETVAAVDFSQSPTSKEATELVDHLVEALGMDFEGGFTIDASAPNFTAQCLEIVQKDVDYAVLTIPDFAAKRFAEDCMTQGYEGAFGASAAIVTPTLYEALVDTQLAGGLTGFPWYADAPPVERYRQAMEDNDLVLEQWGRGDSTAGWATMELFRSALEANAKRLSPRVTRGEVLAAYYTIKNEDLDGLLPGPVTYTKGEPAPAPSCFWLYSYENEEFSGTFEPTCPDPSLGVG